MATLRVGERAPHFSLAALDGNRYTFASTPEAPGELTALIFFKTTCPTCQYAWPYYERLSRAYKPAGLEVWGISQHDIGKTRSFAAQYKATFPHLIDDKFVVSREYDPDFVPTGFMADPNGSILDIFASWNSARLNEISEQIATRLRVQPQPIVKPVDNAISFKAG